ncbi:hypothetical protein GMB86_01460 [Terrilactibacillus sp. BCM23-1]|uniref:Rubrerythrin diiron-binding domain-containing protein n=1 Tax=Terrilactibacillus tamarindi TaxID=2599694 RepID=A0A6N8CLK6_9BACI|nr:ferritin-like domain-containing protein [Terrilactibacillus tamarindi]MTT30681.1 hypothetical protein [Terrilactibacillus tamarindi]
MNLILSKEYDILSEIIEGFLLQSDVQNLQNYLEVLKFRVEDEQNTVDFYMEIADQSRLPIIKETFQRAAKDEQNHAVWFLLFLTQK